MASLRKKSITDLITSKPQSRKPSVAEIDKITTKIHEGNQANSKPLPLPVAEKIKRMSITAPIQLYIKAHTKATIQGQTLMAYIISLIEADVKNDVA